MNELLSKISSLKIKDIIFYLKRKKWFFHESRKNKNLLLFTGHKDDYGNSIQLILPSSENMQESKIRILEAIKLIAAVENRGIDEVIISIKAKSKDVLETRVIDASLNSGSIPLEMAKELITNFRNILACAAKLERKPDPFYFKTKSKESEEFIRRCRLGQTFEGSFGFRIEVPIPASVETGCIQENLLGHDENEMPFERRVMLRLFRGFLMIKESTVNDNVKKLIDNYKKGFNANIYDYLQKSFSSLPEVGFDYSVSWSPDWPVPENIAKIKNVHLDSDSCRFIETAANELRKTVAPENVTIRGYIVQLRAEYMHDEDNDYTGNVIIKRIEREKDPINVRFSLDVNDYKKACEAHKNKKLVEITGKLKKPRKNWELDSPINFNVL